MITRHETNIISSHEYQQKPLHRKWLDYFADLDPEHEGDEFSKVQEAELARRIQAGLAARESEPSEENVEIIAAGDIARKALFEVNIRFALYCARESVGIAHPSSQAKLEGFSFRRINGNAPGTYAPIRSLQSPYADLEHREQSALEGLWHAAGKFNPEKEKGGKDKPGQQKSTGNKKKVPKFITYAAWYIQGKIQADATSEERMIVIPAKEDAKIRSAFHASFGDRTLMPEDVRDIVNRTDYYDNIDSLSPVTGRESLHDEDDDIPHNLSDIWADTRETNQVDKDLERAALTNALVATLSRLLEQEDYIIRMQYGIYPFKRPHTLDEIGDRLSLKREVVRRTGLLALAKLQHPTRSHELVDWRWRNTESIPHYTGDSIDARLPHLELPQPIEQFKQAPSTPVQQQLRLKDTLESWQLFKDEKWEDPVRFERDNLLDDESYARIVNLITNVSPWHFDRRSYSKNERAYSHSLMQHIEKIAGRKRMSPRQLEFLWSSFAQTAYPRLEESLGHHLSGDQIGRFFSRILQTNIDTPQMASSLITFKMPEGTGKFINYFASGLTKGTIQIEGDIGSHVAAKNSGITNVIVKGNTGQEAGAAMRGHSELTVTGYAGYLTGDKMRDHASIFIGEEASSVSEDLGYNTQVRQYVSYGPDRP